MKGDVNNKRRDYLKKAWPTKDGKIQIYNHLSSVKKKCLKFW